MASNNGTSQDLSEINPGALATLLGVPLEKLVLIASTSHKRYRHRRKAKHDSGGARRYKNGKREYRHIHAPGRELKSIQQTLNRWIVNTVKFPLCVYGVKGASAIDNARKHQGKRFHFLTDLLDFFPSVKSPRICEAFCDLGLPEETAKLIRDLVTHGGSLPQGSPTSNAVANLVLRKMDLELDNFAQEHGLVYTRYVDDLTFSGNEHFQCLCACIMDIIENHRFQRKHDKTYYHIGPVRITGAMAGQNRLIVPKSIAAKYEDPTLSEIQREGLREYSKQIRFASD